MADGREGRSSGLKVVDEIQRYSVGKHDEVMRRR